MSFVALLRVAALLLVTFRRLLVRRQRLATVYHGFSHAGAL
jgi:hypothetical protein